MGASINKMNTIVHSKTDEYTSSLQLLLNSNRSDQQDRTANTDLALFKSLAVFFLYFGISVGFTEFCIIMRIGDDTVEIQAPRKS